MKILIVSLVGGWTLSSEGGAYTVDDDDICVEGTCTPTGDVRIREDGVWDVGNQVEVRWDSPSTAKVRRGSGPWVTASLKSNVGAPSPWAGTPGERLTPQWKHGVLPGFWQAATYHCEEGTQAWVFNPVVKEEKELIVRKVGDGWAFGEGAEIVKCAGNFGGVSERKR